MNGQNTDPVFYDGVETSEAVVTNNLNVGSYQEVTTSPYPDNSPPSMTPVLSEICPPPKSSDGGTRGRAPLPESDLTNPSKPAQKLQRAADHAIQNISKSQALTHPKKRGRKRLSEAATVRMRKEAEKEIKSNIEVLEKQIPKKRGRKPKTIGQSFVNDGNLPGDKVEFREPKKECEELSPVNKVKTEEAHVAKKGQKRSHKKTEAKIKIEDKSISTGLKNRNTKKQRVDDYHQKSRAPMAYPKGTFLIRYSDLETLDSDQIWCVDNHYLLLKYRLSSHIEGKRRLYLKSQPERFVGWKCEEPWHFHPLTVVERERDGSKVLVIYPDAKELAEYRKEAQHQKQLAEKIKNENANDNDAEQSKQHMEMDEAANAIERFILIPEDDYGGNVDEYVENE